MEGRMPDWQFSCGGQGSGLGAEPEQNRKRNVERDLWPFALYGRCQPQLVLMSAPHLLFFKPDHTNSISFKWQELYLGTLWAFFPFPLPGVSRWHFWAFWIIPESSLCVRLTHFKDWECLQRLSNGSWDLWKCLTSCVRLCVGVCKEWVVKLSWLVTVCLCVFKLLVLCVCVCVKFMCICICVSAF